MIRLVEDSLDSLEHPVDEEQQQQQMQKEGGDDDSPKQKNEFLFLDDESDKENSDEIQELKDGKREEKGEIGFSFFFAKFDGIKFLNEFFFVLLFLFFSAGSKKRKRWSDGMIERKTSVLLSEGENETHEEQESQFFLRLLQLTHPLTFFF